MVLPRQPRRPTSDAQAPAGDAEFCAALALARGGDESAFSTVYRAIQPRLLRYVRVLVGAEAEDVAAEAWIHIVRDLHRFSGDADAFRAWTATIARNRALDHLRRARSRPQAADVAVDDLHDLRSPDDVDEAALARLGTDRAIALIATLPRDQAEAVVLRAVVGLDAEAAARVLGKRAGAVRMAAHRGLARLAESIVASSALESTRVGLHADQGVTDLEARALREV